MTAHDVVVGAMVRALKSLDGEQFWHEAEVMALRRSPHSGTPEFYVHYTDFNKRLDEWVGIERIDLSSVKAPAAAGAANSSKKAVPAAKKTVVAKKAPAKAKSAAARKRDRTSSTRRGAVLVPSSEEEDSGDATGHDAHGESCGDGQASGGAEQKNEQTELEQEMEKLRRGGSMTHRLEEVSRVKNFARVEMGRHVVQTWYFAPYPEELLAQNDSGTLFLCEFCLAYFGRRTDLQRHRAKCDVLAPVGGREIYRAGKHAFWELDGHRHKVYCRNLCLLSKLFLDHKTLFYDVDPFLFYVLTERDERGEHLLGYFSKEKESADHYNVACILTLPQHQRKGYGRLLIEFSYALTRREGTVGSPEKPLSDLGLLSYRRYWCEAIVEYLLGADAPAPETTEAPGALCQASVDQISRATGITAEDILHTLQAMDALRYHNGQYVIVLSQKHIEDYEKHRPPGQSARGSGRGASKRAEDAPSTRLRIDESLLRWTPPVFTAAQLRFL